MEKVRKFDLFFFYFVIIDILFFPYVSFIAITFSQLPIFLWFIFKDKSYFDKNEIKLYFIITSLIILSVLISIFFIPESLFDKYFIENLKVSTNIILGISYYFFFKYNFNQLGKSIDNIFILFLIYISLWGLLYFFNNPTFITLKKIFNPRDATLSLINIYENYFLRFNFIWTDPNNVGYALVGIVSFIILTVNSKNRYVFISIILLAFNLLIIMSAGSLIVAAIIIPISLLMRMQKIKSKKIVFISFLSTALAFSIIGYNLDKFYESDIGRISSSRLEEKTLQGDTRGEIWITLLNNKNILTHVIIGEGPTIFVDNLPYSPHNGHLMFIFSYGLICYLAYIVLFFKKYKMQTLYKYTYLLPFLICFTVNIGIGELKFAAIMYMIIAYSRTESKLKVKF